LRLQTTETIELQGFAVCRSLEALPADGILGMDFLTEFGAIIDTRNRIMKIGSDAIPLEERNAIPTASENAEKEMDWTPSPVETCEGIQICPPPFLYFQPDSPFNEFPMDTC
jgi:hypothetical protein